MVVGVPGTGIGGLFYLVMAAYMPLREGYRTLRGRSSLSRWRFIAVQLALVGGIVGAMTLQAIVARWALSYWAATTTDTHLAKNLNTLIQQQTGSSAAFATFASITMLTFVVLLVHVLRLTAGRKTRPTARQVG